MYYNLSDIPVVRIERINTCIDEMNWLWGGEWGNWGIPVGKISLFYGKSGCGKSRALIEMSRLISNWGKNVLYIQTEDTLSSFRSWVGNIKISDRFKVSSSNELDEQLSEIIFSDADLVIVDSINQLKEFGNGGKSSINHIIQDYRQVTKECGSHIIFVGQVTKQEDIKGGAELPHLVDTVFEADHFYRDKKKVDGYFVIRVGEKHRYGKTGGKMFAVWQHCSDRAICISDNRLYDEDWCYYWGEKIKEGNPV